LLYATAASVVGSVRRVVARLKRNRLRGFPMVTASA
jgi:hypothetical protein